MSIIATELINYQNKDSFPDDLGYEIEKIYNEIDNFKYTNNKELITKSEHVKHIEKLIKDRFNLNIVFDKELHNYTSAAIIPFLSDYLTNVKSIRNISPSMLGSLFSAGNIFKHIKQLEKEKESYLKEIHNKKGFIDLKNARVGGYLGDVKHYLIINFFRLKEAEMTPREVVAIISHEIGHAFVGLESHHRLTTTNATITDILDNINKNKVDKAYYIFKKHFDPKDIEKASLDDNKDITDFYSKLAVTYIGELNSQLTNSKYDETNWENLADSFACRFNLSRELVSSLNKIHRRDGSVINNTRSTYFSVYFIEVMFYVLLLAIFGPIATSISLLTVTMIYNNSNNVTMTYDFPVERYNRIKNNVINNLKNKDLPEDVKNDLLDSYEFIDKVIKESGNFKSMLSHLADIVIPSNRENNYYIHLQQTIENNLNNILFVKSAQISRG